MAQTSSADRSPLPIRVASRRLVKASDTSIKPYVHNFTNLEISNNSQGCVACLYPRVSTGDFRAVAAAFRTHLPAFLNFFFPWAGRIVPNAGTGRPELHCSNQGAELLIGEVDVAREGTIAGVAREGGRRPAVFQPRDPPAYGAEVADAFRPCEHARMVNVLTVADSTVERLYYVEARDVARLVCRATVGERISRVHAFSAYTWKALAGVVAASTSLPEEDKRCGLLLWVDARQRFSSPELLAAMRDYLGFGCAYVHREASAAAILGKPLAEVAGVVREAIQSKDYDATLQDITDWLEVHAGDAGSNHVEAPAVGLGSPTLAQTMWSSFPTDLDFGFGQASLIMPVDKYAERLASGLLLVAARPGGDGSWIVSAEIWRCLAEAFEADQEHIFKPLTADYLGFVASSSKKNQMSRL